MMMAAAAAMEEKITPVIIDNTNTVAWEMKPYLKMVSHRVSNSACIYTVCVHQYMYMI